MDESSENRIEPSRLPESSIQKSPSAGLTVSRCKKAHWKRKGWTRLELHDALLPEWHWTAHSLSSSEWMVVTVGECRSVRSAWMCCSRCSRRYQRWSLRYHHFPTETTNHSRWIFPARFPRDLPSVCHLCLNLFPEFSSSTWSSVGPVSNLLAWTSFKFIAVQYLCLATIRSSMQARSPRITIDQNHSLTTFSEHLRSSVRHLSSNRIEGYFW